MKYCINCGSQLPDAAKYCTCCGKALPQPAKEALAASPKAALSQTEKPLKAPIIAASDIKYAIPAASQAGELPAGESFRFGGELLEEYAAAKDTALSPVRAVFMTVSSFFAGIWGLIKRPKNLIPVLIATLVWTGLWLLRNSDSQVVRLLSFLTYANFGEDRSAFGIIGNALGKGTVAALWASLFSGGIPALFKGIGSMRGRSEEKRSIVNLVIGAIVGAALYFAYTGIKYASAATAMAGIAGAVLALQAIGRKSGPLYGLAQALSCKVENGVRSAQSGKTRSLLLGLSLGFAIATLVMLFVRL